MTRPHHLTEAARVYLAEARARMQAVNPLDALALLDAAAPFGDTLEDPDLLTLRTQALQALGWHTHPPAASTVGHRADAAPVTPCPLCTDHLRHHETLHHKQWLVCPGCGFLQTKLDADMRQRLDRGEPAGAKQPPHALVHTREGYFCDLFLNAMGWNSALIYGAGWSLVPEQLLERSIDVVGCDLWEELIAARKAELGYERFVHRDELPERTFQLISAFEVFEHFTDPLHDVGLLASRLADEGAIVGCTDFWHGGSLLQHRSADSNYWKHITHVTAWCPSSLRQLATRLHLQADFFRVDTPGFGAKGFFVLHRGRDTGTFVHSLPPLIRGAF